jgi:hypothetical protein
MPARLQGNECWQSAADSEARAPLRLLKNWLPVHHYGGDVVAVFEAAVSASLLSQSAESDHIQLVLLAHRR